MEPDAGEGADGRIRHAQIGRAADHDQRGRHDERSSQRTQGAAAYRRERDASGPAATFTIDGAWH